ncbi:MAG TPA: TIM-barrel domain-containing protein [Phnomibacter sp.]|nr:TIM-barrel domain-containing protein [Phnomibacter sp.]
MKKILNASACIALVFLCLSQPVQAQQKKYEKVSTGVIVYPDATGSNVQAVQLQVMSDRIIRVVASPEKRIQAANSLAVVAQPVSSGWTVNEVGDAIEIATAQVKAQVQLHTGAVRFLDLQNNLLLAEKSSDGKLIQPVMFEGQRLYSTTQHFQSADDEGYYGLGQQQDDSWNYKGKQVILFQNNSQIAIPFLVSTNHYGILWDNYSYSKVGDIRPFQQLSDLQLFDKKGKAGWLTAVYANDRKKPSEVLYEKAESEIWYPFLNDTKTRLPKEFNIQKGMISWEGSMASAVSGVHQFHFTYGGYLKCWIDGKLLFDKWRQAWNPATALIGVDMVAGKKHSVKIQWIPDGGESYVSARFLHPASSEMKNVFSFNSEAGKHIDYYFVYGSTPDEIVAGYRTLTGKAHIVPKWAMGFWQSRERYKTQEDVLNTVAEFRKRKIPLDNIVQDWFYWKENDWGSQKFDKTRFSNPDSMIDVLHKKYHAQFMISVWPKFYADIPEYKTFDKNNWMYTRNVADSTKDWVGPGYLSSFYDVFNEQARKAFWDLLNTNLFQKKVDAWWMDASEPDVNSNVSPEKRKQLMQPLAIGTAAEFMNAYPLQNAKGIYEGQRGVNDNQRVFLLTRSAFAGSQRYAASVWSGDVAARWEDMRTQITAGMNYSISGLPYWTMDIGGFSVEPRYENPNAEDLAEWRELQTRWYQWGSFLPLFRSHGQFPVREVYNVAPEGHPAYNSMLYYNQLRYRLMPYTYSLAGHAYHNDYTIMRGLVMDFSADTKARAVPDQFMFGPSLLINPVYQYKATGRSVYLPTGQGWYDLYTGAYLNGGQTIQANAPYEKLPVYVKAGSIIPTGPALQYVAEKPADPITILVYAGADGKFSLYEDEGLNYNYEKEQFAEIAFTYNDATKTLEIADRKGSFPGMLASRTFYFKFITPSHAVPLSFDDTKGLKKVKYTGKKVSVKW